MAISDRVDVRESEWAGKKMSGGYERETSAECRQEQTGADKSKTSENNCEQLEMSTDK